MVSPRPYLHFAGTARDALAFYESVFGGNLTLHTFGDFGREDGPADAVAHGILQGPVDLYAADAGAGDESFASTGLMLSLLGASDPAALTAWFGALAAGGTVVDDLQERAWGASDGQVRDRYGVLWLIGYEH